MCNGQQTNKTEPMIGITNICTCIHASLSHVKTSQFEPARSTPGHKLIVLDKTIIMYEGYYLCSWQWLTLQVHPLFCQYLREGQGRHGEVRGRGQGQELL